MSKEIVINNFQKEIAPSSFVGFEEIRNLNTVDKPGVIYPNYILSKHSGTSVTARPIWMKSSGNELWMIDYAGNVYDISGSTYTKRTGFSTNLGQGLDIWKDHVFVIGNTEVEVLKLSDNSVTTSWDGNTIDNASTHPSLVGQDDKFYVVAGRYVASYQQVDGKTFDPTDTSTFVFKKRAIDLPEGYIGSQLTELGRWIAIGTKKSNDADIADIFLWDRESTSFDMSIQIAGNGVQQMTTINNRLYILVGGFGKWYISDGSSVEFFTQLPKTMVNITGATGTLVYPGAITKFKDKIYFSILAEAEDVPFGVYSLNTKTGGFILEHTISTNNVRDNNTKRIGTLLVKDGSLYVGWEDNSTYGVDKLSSTTRYTNDRAFFISQFYRVGTKYSPRTFKSLEIQLSKPLASGDVVKVYYRTNQDTRTWTAITTMDNDGDQSKRVDFATTAENIQFKVSLDDEAELLELRIS